MRRASIVSGSLIFVCGLLMIFVVVPAQIKSFGGFGLHPAFFPLLLLWLIVVMAALLVLTRLPHAPGNTAEHAVIDGGNWAFVAGVAVVMVAGFIAIEKLGFVIGGAGLAIVLMVAIERQNVRWLEIAGVSLIAPFAIYWVLYHLFSVQLPLGPFFQ